ncbi:MAG: HAD family hydrolase [Elusimicrobiota bacterium]
MPKAIIFDFDGVILQSVDIKTRAFEALFAFEGPEAVARIVDHHRANGGVSRYEKFRHAYREILRRPLSAEQEKTLGERFNILVEDAVSACPWVPGAREFLEARHKQFPLFIASGTPQEELSRIVERRGLNGFFRAVYGTPAQKDAILRKIAADLPCAPEDLLMVGDAGGDYEAAHAVGAAFVGVVAPGVPNPFLPGVAVLPDLTGLETFL